MNPLLALVPIALVAAWVLLRRSLLVVSVGGQSLSPLLEPGDRVLALRPPLASRPKRGDLYVVWPFDAESLQRARCRYYIKQVTVVGDAELTTTLDELEPCERPKQAPFHDADGRRTWRVPPGHVFLRGTGTLGGNDSLSWGPVPYESLVAKVIRRLPSGEDPFLAEAGPESPETASPGDGGPRGGGPR